MLSSEAKRRIHVIASSVVAAHCAVGQSEETTRHEARKSAANALAKVAGEAAEKEAYMAEVERGIEHALRQHPKD